MKLTLKTTIETTQEIDISEPMYFKDIAGSITEVIAVIEETTIQVWAQPRVKDLIKITATEDERFLIANCINKSYKSITEQEFFEVFDRVYESLSYKPKLKTITAKEGSEVSL